MNRINLSHLWICQGGQESGEGGSAQFLHQLSLGSFELAHEAQAARLRLRARRAIPEKAFTTGKAPMMEGLAESLDQRGAGGNAA